MTMLTRDPFREEWLNVSHELTLSLLTGWPSVDSFTQIVSHTARVPGVHRALVLVDHEVAQKLNPASPSIHIVSDDRFLLARAVCRSAVESLPRELTDATGLPTGPAMVVPLADGGQDYGILVIVRLPGEPHFQLEEVAVVEAFATRAATILAHLHGQRSHEAQILQDDRARIAANLHDLVIQQLFGIGLRLQSLTSRVEPEEAAADLNSSVDQIDETIRAVRRSIFALRQPIADHVGLRSRILNVVNATPLPFEPSVHFNGPIDSAIRENVRDELLASLGESLTNVLRHAKATSVHILVAADLQAQQAVLTVSDDGVGWSGVPKSGHGSGNLLDRAAELGGSCEITMTDGGGTRVRWWAPLEQPGRITD